MFLVALLTGSTNDPGAEARLAKAIGSTAYEARLALAAGFPTLVFTTADEARANALASLLRDGGDDAVACDAGTIAAADEMIDFDGFTLNGDGVTAAGQSLPYADILCLLRAVHRARATTETRSTERKFDVAKSLFTGGLSNTKTVEKQTREGGESREQVLYVFRRSGATPWLLRETGTNYGGLGAARGPAAPANFATTSRLLRERAPTAVYDERLTRAHRVPERSSKEGIAAKSVVRSSFASGIDMLAHLVALTVRRATSTPFRGLGER